MIRLNCSLITETEHNHREAIAKAIELVEYSLHDKGVIDYDLYESRTNSDRLMIVETWESADDLKRHMESDHFRRLVPELQKLGNMTLERFDF